MQFIKIQSSLNGPQPDFPDAGIVISNLQYSYFPITSGPSLTRGLLTTQVLLPDSSLQTLETLIHFRSEGQQEAFFIQAVRVYVANGRRVGL
jgi:subtilase family serine protease